ncbi:AMP-dependent synthetase/ligase, partial [Xanthovirga aplysinae]|uniref:AMP-dependent synthetase/ligase n=1 Tax=Xanthovirga aplysinae TaxID=2529853 RepID=UPI0012BC50C4
MNFERIFDFLHHQVQEKPLEDALACKKNGIWKKYSSLDFLDTVNNVSLGLMKLGVEKGDKIGIISFNRPEWNFIDFGIQQLGAISVPMYPNSTIEDYQFILEDAEVKYLFVADQGLYEKGVAASEQIDGVKGIFTFDKISSAKHWLEVEQLGKEEGKREELEIAKNQVQFTDLLTIIYTSGTTGRPKGVKLTHKNVISNSLSMVEAVPHNEGRMGRTLSFLPLCHIFERTSNYVSILLGNAIYYAESMETIAENIKEVKPHTFSTVPRLLEKVYDKFITKGMELQGLKKALFFWALNLGLRFDPSKNQGGWYNFQLSLANKLIFSKMREALGGNVEFIVSGAAALQPRLARVFWSAGIKVLEGYGLTETSPGVTFTSYDPDDVRIGTVGVPIKGVKVKIAEDGEVLVKGDNVMEGYYKRPDATSEAIDSEGWFHTGDIGKLIENRYLKITDRKKEMFKTSGGKYIAPQVIENKFKESLLIEQVMVVGEGQKFPAALLVPFEQGLHEWCTHKGIPLSNLNDLLKNEKVIDKFQKEVDRLNENFAQFERIKKFVLLPEPWTVDGGELT